MMRQQEQNKKKARQAIAPKQVWLSMTDKQQEQFTQTLEAICQRLTSRQMSQEEENDATGEPS